MATSAVNTLYVHLVYFLSATVTFLRFHIAEARGTTVQLGYLLQVRLCGGTSDVLCWYAVRGGRGNAPSRENRYQKQWCLSKLFLDATPVLVPHAERLRDIVVFSLTQLCRAKVSQNHQHLVCRLLLGKK